MQKYTSDKINWYIGDGGTSAFLTSEGIIPIKEIKMAKKGDCGRTPRVGSKGDAKPRRDLGRGLGRRRK